MYARSSTFQARPDSVDDGIAFCRDEVMRSIEGLRGFVGLSMMVDRGSGRCIATSAWDTRAHMRSSDEVLSALRARGGEIMGAAPTVEEWDISVLHRVHLTSPETCTRVSWLSFELTAQLATASALVIS